MADFTKSEEYCRKALKIDDTSVSVHNILGSILKTQGRREEAIESFTTAISLKQDFLEAYINLTNLYIEMERLEEAYALANRAASFSQHIGIKTILGNLSMKQGLFEQARSHYHEVLQQQPDNIDALVNLGQVAEHLGDFDSAIEAYRKVLAISPGSDHSIIGIASILEKQKRLEEALSVLEPVASQSSNLRIHTIYGRIHTRLKQYDKAEAILSAARDLQAADQYRQELLFELGDVLDKQKRYDEAFEIYSKANKMYHHKFNTEQLESLFMSIKEAYTAKTIDALPSSGNTSDIPVFIVDMPRSGTSLVEQILASHDCVHGAGELDDIDDIIGQINSNGRVLYPADPARLDNTLLRELADKYLEIIRKLSPASTRITNKMPHNFQHLGLIFQLFPHARIIHCTRNPRDTALSIYFHQFNQNHPYASDLSDLSFYHNQYSSLMAHWDNVFGDRIHTISYENLVENLEHECRRLIEFCGLEWQQSCLQFHNNSRTVNTPSYHQVRQPLYRDALDRNRHYSVYLEGFEYTG